MYVYIYVCIYLCMYIFMHVYIYACIYLCMYIFMHVYIYVCIYLCMYIFMHVYIYACIYLCMYIFMYVYIYVCMYVCMANIHTPYLKGHKSRGISCSTWPAPNISTQFAAYFSYISVKSSSLRVSKLQLKVESDTMIQFSWSWPKCKSPDYIFNWTLSLTGSNVLIKTKVGFSSSTIWLLLLCFIDSQLACKLIIPLWYRYLWS